MSTVNQEILMDNVHRVTQISKPMDKITQVYKGLRDVLDLIEDENIKETIQTNMDLLVKARTNLRYISSDLYGVFDYLETSPYKELYDITLIVFNIGIFH